MSCCGAENREIALSCCSEESTEKSTDSCSTLDSTESHRSSTEAADSTLSCCTSEELASNCNSYTSSESTTDFCSTAEKESCCSNSEEVTTVMDSVQEGQKIEYKVYGMDCPSCASTIEKGLQRLKNVISAKVNYNTEKLQVVADGGYSPTQVENTIQNLGFTAERIFQNNNMRIYRSEEHTSELQ